MITQEEAEKAIHSIMENAHDIAESKATKEYLEEFRKSKKALLIQSCPLAAAKTVQDKESYAYGHPDYLELLEGLREASETYERRRWKMIGWQVLVDAWRTQESSRRQHG
jgi:hypothetical protein